MPPLELLNDLLLAPFLALAEVAEDDPRAGHLLVLGTAASDSGHGRVRDEVGGVSQKTVLNLDGGDLRAGNFERVLEEKQKSAISHWI
jgi:hypothetical protein